ncbi:hypothetical protein [uncultured Sanguibacteroides sp.]|uniref:hypothetical protein n=1 Tax=uncultured Sanguibacteroides sp. TaxID=1635151 RepID=UPI0025E57E22|nr:hypothetical protein [uncultured Sanguibacteroides sp.]
MSGNCILVRYYFLPVVITFRGKSARRHGKVRGKRSEFAKSGLPFLANSLVNKYIDVHLRRWLCVFKQISETSKFSEHEITKKHHFPNRGKFTRHAHEGTPGGDTSG